MFGSFHFYAMLLYQVYRTLLINTHGCSLRFSQLSEFISTFSPSQIISWLANLVSWQCISIQMPN